MQAQNTNPKPTAAEVDDAWAAYELLREAAVKGGWTEDLSLAAAMAAGAYYRLKKAAEACEIAY